MNVRISPLQLLIWVSENQMNSSAPIHVTKMSSGYNSNKIIGQFHQMNLAKEGNHGTNSQYNANVFNQNSQTYY